MNARQRGFASLALVLLIVAAIVGGFWFYKGNFTILPSVPQGTPTPNPEVEIQLFNLISKDPTSLPTLTYRIVNSPMYRSSTYYIVHLDLVNKETGAIYSLRGKYPFTGMETLDFARTDNFDTKMPTLDGKYFLRLSTEHIRTGDVKVGAESAVFSVVAGASVVFEENRAAATAPAKVTPVTLDVWNWRGDVLKDNTYTISVGDAITIPKNSWTDSEFLLHVYFATNDTAYIQMERLADNNTYEAHIRVGEEINFFHCPSFDISLVSLADTKATLTVQAVPCTL